MAGGRSASFASPDNAFDQHGQHDQCDRHDQYDQYDQYDQPARDQHEVAMGVRDWVPATGDGPGASTGCKGSDVEKRKLLLVGGGHAHLFVLEALRRQPTRWNGKFDVTLLSSTLQTAYSGMLPGLIAGHYRSSECHVDLRPLAESAGVRLIEATVDRLDADAGIAGAAGMTWPYELASIDIGSLPPLDAVPGASQYAIGIKPVDGFLSAWAKLQQETSEAPVASAGGGHSPPPGGRVPHVVVVGGGAGGVELVLAMAWRLKQTGKPARISLVTRGALLEEHPAAVRRLAQKAFAKAGVAVRAGSRVSQVEEGVLHLEGGGSAAWDVLLWATGAAPQAWVRQAGLACTADGFIVQDDQLRSTSHPNVFAAGDIATQPGQPQPKAGVFAVRQGPVLAENLLRAMAGEPGMPYVPQAHMLSLLATGGQHAIASWHGFGWQGDWVWQWKNRIDRGFVARFTAPFR
jgi:selenide,water dikinase